MLKVPLTRRSAYAKQRRMEGSDSLFFIITWLPWKHAAGRQMQHAHDPAPETESTEGQGRLISTGHIPRPQKSPPKYFTLKKDHVSELDLGGGGKETFEHVKRKSNVVCWNV